MVYELDRFENKEIAVNLVCPICGDVLFFKSSKQVNKSKSIKKKSLFLDLNFAKH